MDSFQGCNSWHITVLEDVEDGEMLNEGAQKMQLNIHMAGVYVLSIHDSIKKNSSWKKPY